MKAAILQAPCQFTVTERPLPQLESGWALVKVVAAGICGSDLHFYTGEMPMREGSVRGHEVAGVVVDPGDTRLSSGVPVIVHPLLGCGNCLACLSGDTHICLELKAIGSDYAGGFAEYIAVPETNLYPFDNHRLLFEHAALADCVAVAVHAMEKVALNDGEKVAIFGDGTIGLLLVQMARIAGASEIVLFGKHERNMKVGLRFGATAAISIQDGVSSVPHKTGATEFDVIFEAVGGASPPYQESLALLRKGGRVGILGLTDVSNIKVPWFDIVFSEKTLMGIMGYSKREDKDEMRKAIGLLEKGAVTLQPLITSFISLPDIDKGFKMMLNKKKGQTIKVVVVLNQTHGELGDTCG